MKRDQQAEARHTGTSQTGAHKTRARQVRPRDQVFGQQAPGTSFLHRMPAGLKVATLAAITVLIVMLRDVVLNGAVIIAVVGLALAARIPPRLFFTLLRRIWLLLALVLVSQLVFNDIATGTEVFGRIMAGILAAHLLILTTALPALLEVFRAMLYPLRLLGIPTGKVVLAAMVMLRAIPFLADQYYLAGQHARARGLQKSLRARTMPILLSSVSYASDTGRALTARGIDGTE